MTLLAPVALWGLLALPLLVLFYLFRPEPRKRASTTYFLWKAALPDSQGGTFAKRLQQNPLLWLQLLIVLLLVLFLARPSTPLTTSTPSTNRVILVIDRSASMQTGQSFDEAKDQAMEAVDNLLGFRLSGSTPEVMLLAVDSSPHVLVPFTKDQGVLNRAVTDLKVTDVPDQLPSLKPFFYSLIKAHKAQVWLFGDHLPEELRIPGMQFTSTADGEHQNVGIISFSVRQPEPERGQKKPFLYCRLENFSASAQQRVLRLEKMRSSDPESVEALVTERTVLLPAGDGRTILEPIPAARLEVEESSVFKLTLSALPNEEPELFQADNVAHCVVAPFASDKLLIAHQAGLKVPFLLRAIASSSGVKVVPLKRLSQMPDAPTLDLLISNPGPVPKSLKYRSRIIVAPPPADKPPIERLQVAQQDAPLVSDSGVEWSRLKVQLSDRSPTADDEVALLKTESGPALTLLGLNQGQPTLKWRFSLAHSSLPLSPALPVVVGRFLNEYSSSGAIPVNGSVTTSQVQRRPTGNRWKGQLELTPSAGPAAELGHQMEVTADAEFLPAFRYSGLYELKGRDGSGELVAVNLFSPQESRLKRDLEDLSFALEDDTTEAALDKQPDSQIQYRSIAVPFLALALLLLLLEAAVFIRRGRP